MKQRFTVDLALLAKVIRENKGVCLCHLGKKCPCDEFIDLGKCTCGVYKE